MLEKILKFGSGYRTVVTALVGLIVTYLVTEGIIAGEDAQQLKESLVWLALLFLGAKGSPGLSKLPGDSSAPSATKRGR